MPSTVRFLLFNLSCFNYGIAGRLPKLVRAAGDPDVLLLNEVPIGLARPIHEALGREWRHALTPSARFAGLLPFRQAILSRAGDSLAFVSSVGLGAGRRLLVTRLTLGARTIVVGVAHLSAEIPWVGRRRRVRERQLARLVNGLRALVEPSEPIVLGGDFNFIRDDRVEIEPEHEEAASRLRDELGLVDVGRLQAEPARPEATWPSEGHAAFGLGPQRLDLFYVSAALAEGAPELRVFDWPYEHTGSDHRPVRLELDLDRSHK